MNNIHEDILAYNQQLESDGLAIAGVLAKTISKALPAAENKIWHGHPVWFLNGNPIVGYSTLKNNLRLLFWSGQSFEEAGLAPEGKFKAAEISYTSVDQINPQDLARWLEKSRTIQWDYKNLVKRKGKLERIS